MNAHLCLRFVKCVQKCKPPYTRDYKPIMTWKGFLEGIRQPPVDSPYTVPVMHSFLLYLISVWTKSRVSGDMNRPNTRRNPYSWMDWFWDRNFILAIHPYTKSLISNTHVPPNAWDNCITEPHRVLCILYANIADLWDHIYIYIYVCIYIYVYIYIYTDITLEIQLTIPICSESTALNRLMYMLYYVGMLDWFIYYMMFGAWVWGDSTYVSSVCAWMINICRRIIPWRNRNIQLSIHLKPSDGYMCQ